MINKKEKNSKSECLNIETIACYVDGILPLEKKALVDRHIAICKDCQDEILCQGEVARLQQKDGLIFVPDYLNQRARDLVNEQVGANILELVVKFSEKAIEIIRTTGEVLLGGQLQPVFALRGQNSELIVTPSIIKIFGNVRVEVEVSRQKEEMNKIILFVKDNQTEAPSTDLRATLVDKDIELESYITRNGKAVFENIKPGNYVIQISKTENLIGIIVLELNKA